MLRTVTLVALAAYVSAQSVSTECRNAISTIALQPDVSACLNPVALLPLLTGNNSVSVVPTIDNWLTGFCAAPACNNATIARIINEASGPCSVELEPLVNVAPLDQVIAVAQRHFPTARRVLCLKQGEDHCVTDTLETLEDQTGDLTLQNILGLVSSPPMSLLTPNNNITCNSCIKQAYNVIVEASPSVNDSFGPIAQAVCGADFIDGQQVAGVTQSANAETASAGNDDNGAATVSGAALTGFAVVSTVYALLA